MSGFIYGLPETFCTFTNNRLLGSYWLFNNRNVFTPFGESIPISRLLVINRTTDNFKRVYSYLCGETPIKPTFDRVVVNLVSP